MIIDNLARWLFIIALTSADFDSRSGCTNVKQCSHIVHYLIIMNLALSQIGTQMSNLTGVRAIMKDIQATLSASKGQEFINLSAGNPVILPEIEQMWRDYTIDLLDSPDYGEVVCRYGSSQGYQPLIDAVAMIKISDYGID